MLELGQEGYRKHAPGAGMSNMWINVYKRSLQDAILDNKFRFTVGRTKVVFSL